MPEITVDEAIAIATRHHEAGRLVEAEGLYRQILALNPKHDDALRLLGIIMMQNGQARQAVDLIGRAIAINPAAQYHINLGNALKAAGDIEAGIEAYREALRINPRYPQAYYNLGVALAEKGSHAEAVEAYRLALQCKPGYSQPLVNLGVALAEIGQIDEAIATYREALRVNPNDSDAYANLGNALRGKDLPDEAITAYEHAIAFKPALAEAHWNLATLLLVRGDFPRGQKEFEWRWKWKDFPTRPRTFAQPLWDGAALRGRTILLYHEQGLGDTIQFIRYAPLVADCGGRVIVQCPPELFRLFTGVSGIAQIVTRDPLPPFDVQCPMMTLPLALATRVETIPASIPYLAVDPVLVQRWRTKVAAAFGRLKVGLVWAGSSTNKKDALRSITFSQMAPLGKVPDITFFSLQKGKAAAECAIVSPGMEFIDLTADLHDFADTASLISHLDLVIAVDTAVAHLAGAMGKPVWVLIPSGPDWRWLLDREDTPWYPTMRLFRQKKVGDWAEAIARVANALSSEIRRVGVLAHLSLSPHDESVGEYTHPTSTHDAGSVGSAPRTVVRDPRESVRDADPTRIAPRDFAPQFDVEETMQTAVRHHLAGSFPQAEELYRQVLSVNPSHARALRLMGTLFGQTDRMDQAIDSLGRAIIANPGDVEAKSNIAVALMKAGRAREALAAAEQAVTIDPQSPFAHWGLAVVLLTTGDFQRGWEEYEWRWRWKDFPSQRRDFIQPLWQGEALDGRTILLHAEQGLGDTIQFIRYASMVAARGGKVIVQCPQTFGGLVRTVAGVGKVVTTEALPAFDFHCPLLSLPRAFATDLDTIPAQVPYVKADANLLRAWGGRLNSSAPGLKVGLVWAGSSTRLNNASRSLALSRFAPLWEMKGVIFYSLQKGSAAQECGTPGPGMQLIDLSPELRDFADTAALISHLDLVIAVDTAVAHLAGAMGKPVWVLIPSGPDWRWLLDREDTPWYPTMRLFRQKKAGDWAEVIARVAIALGHCSRSGVAVDTNSRITGVSPVFTVLRDANGNPIEERHGRDAHDTVRYYSSRSDPVKRDPAPTLEKMMETAVRHHLAGSFPEAEKLYQQVLSVNPSHARALRLMGTLFGQTGRLDEAIEWLQRAVSTNPGDAEAHFNLGVALMNKGRRAQAISAYRQAVVCRAGYSDALHNLGVALLADEQVDDAIAAFNETLRLKPDQPLAQMTLGIALLKRGDLDEAVAAEKQSLRLQPDNAQALHVLGSALKRKGELVEAAEACRAAIRIKNDYADAHSMLGNILTAMRRYDEALASYQQALAHHPRHYSACLNIGYCLAKMGRYVEAQAATRRAIEIEPDLADLHYNLGNSCKDLGDLKQAVAAYERAIELDPKCADAHWNLAVVLLLQGDFRRGWVEHEWRWQVQDSPSHRRHFEQPQWNGQDLAGKTILLHTEQGFGDAMQFIRYAPLVARRGGRVVLQCSPAVSRLFATVAGIEQLVTTERLPPFDVHCPLMSLPLAFSSCMETIPAQVPYLKVDPALAERWGKKLHTQATGVKVGLAWAGRPTNKNDAARSLSLSRLAPLQKVSGVTFYSLQKEKVRAENPPVFPVIDCSEDFRDFAETAAMISHLDLVISVDTAVAHLAGALAKPVWLLIPFIPDWRWMMDRQDSPWYPTMRLFRQKRGGDWVDVIERVEQALREML